MFSPILGATTIQSQSTKSQEDRLTLVDDQQQEGEQLYPQQPTRTKKRR